jgi:hypothetical protein
MRVWRRLGFGLAVVGVYVLLMSVATLTLGHHPLDSTWRHRTSNPEVIADLIGGVVLVAAGILVNRSMRRG